MKMVKPVNYFRDGKESKLLGSCSVRDLQRLGSDSSSMELETCFPGGRLLRINCNCKHQLID